VPSPSSSPGSSPPFHSLHYPATHKTVSTTTTTTTTTTFVDEDAQKGHKRSISDPFKEEEVDVVPVQKVQKAKTPQPPDEADMYRRGRSRANSWHTKQSQLATNFVPKQRSHKRPVTLVDAYTQTTHDASTQTSDDDLSQPEDFLIQAAQLLIRGAIEKKEKKMRLSVKSMSFNGQTELPPPTERMHNRTTESDILSDLNDLEEEIAMMRFKAMSLQEQMKWINQEKSMRPGAPVMDSETHIVKPKMISPLSIPNSSSQKSSPNSSFSSSSENFFRSPTVEFTDSKPDRCFSPVSIPIKATQDITRAMQVASPDSSKRKELILETGSSAFSTTLRSQPKFSRLCKSLGELPGLPTRSESNEYLATL